MKPLDGYTFTRSQKRGLLILFTSLFGVLGIWAAAKWFDSPSLPSQQAPELFTQPYYAPDTLQRIDINLAEPATWAQLPGIGPVLSQRIVNYRRALGGFTDVAQVAKVYGIKPEVFAEIEPRLYLSELTAPLQGSKFGHPKTYSRAVSPALPHLDINVATAEELALLPGLGKVLSNRIVKFREALGGFDSLAQLNKVYNLPPETLADLQPYLYLTPETKPRPQPAPAPLLADTQGPAAGRQYRSEADITRIDLNQADEAALVALPGIGPKLAPRIVRYREILGFYREVSQLRQVYGLSEENFQRMAPYLLIDDLPEVPRKDLNMASARQLAYYPAISKELAAALVANRRKVGRFDTWAEVAKTPGLPTEAVVELQTYFTLDPGSQAP
jgi:competence protein ComEA